MPRDNDEKVELSKIVRRGGDADAKVTTSLELADVVRQAANLGAHATPRSSGCSRRPTSQKNLPGLLVVDAVPAASPAYLEAIMGRDLHAKRDDAVDRASGRADPPPMATFLGLFNRDHDTNPTPAAPSASTPTTARRPSTATPTMARRPSTGADPSDAELPPLPGAPASTVATGGPTAPGTAPAAKKDDAVQQTSASGAASASPSTPTPTPTRRRFLDFLRRNDDD